MLGPQMPRCQHRLHDTQMVRKTKEEAEITRLPITDAARRVFLECGVSHTSLEKIPAAAGVGARGDEPGDGWARHGDDIGGWAENRGA